MKAQLVSGYFSGMGTIVADDSFLPIESAKVRNETCSWRYLWQTCHWIYRSWVLFYSLNQSDTQEVHLALQTKGMGVFLPPLTHPYIYIYIYIQTHTCAHMQYIYIYIYVCVFSLSIPWQIKRRLARSSRAWTRVSAWQWGILTVIFSMRWCPSQSSSFSFPFYKNIFSWLRAFSRTIPPTITLSWSLVELGGRGEGEGFRQVELRLCMPSCRTFDPPGRIRCLHLAQGH